MNRLKTIIRKAAKGDEKAIEVLVRISEAECMFSARTITGNQPDAEEVMQRAYIRMFRSLDTLKDPKKFVPWMRKIVENEALSLVTGSQRKHSIVFSDLEATLMNGKEISYEIEDERIDSRPDLLLDQKTRQNIIQEIMDKLPDSQRTTVYLYYFKHLKISEIAEELSCSENTVKSRLKYAKESIRKSVLKIEEKDGIKLYNLAPITYFAYVAEEVQKGIYSVNPSHAAIVVSKIAEAVSQTGGAGLAETAETGNNLVGAALVKIGLTMVVGTAGIGGAAVAVRQEKSSTAQQNVVFAEGDKESADIEDEPAVIAAVPDEKEQSEADSPTDDSPADVNTGEAEKPKESYDEIQIKDDLPKETVNREPQEGDVAVLVGGNTKPKEITEETSARHDYVGGGKTAGESEQVQAEQISSTGGAHTGMKTETLQNKVTIVEVKPIPVPSPEVATEKPNESNEPDTAEEPESSASSESTSPSPSYVPENTEELQPTAVPSVSTESAASPLPSESSLDYSTVGEELKDFEQEGCPAGMVYVPELGLCAW